MELPLGLVTVTSTVPGDSGGETAVIDVSEFTLKLAAGTAPKATAVEPVNWIPEMVTAVPPAIGPELGETPLTMGANVYVKVSAGLAEDVPSGLVTVTSTVPAFPPAAGGAVAVSDVSELTVNPVAGTPPKSTAVVPVNAAPLMVTDVPPVTGPSGGT